MKSFKGTALYLSPNVIKKHYNKNCDIWACGIIIYFIITKKAVFSGENES